MILLPNTAQWEVANWVVRAFVRDAADVVALESPLGKQIQFCIDAEFDTIDLRNADPGALREMASVVGKVEDLNKRRDGSHFHQPEMFPVYLAKLESLRKLVDDAIRR